MTEGTLRSAGCLDERTLYELVSGALSPAARAVAEAHVAGCGECAVRVAGLRRSSAPPSAFAAAATGEPNAAFLQHPQNTLPLSRGSSPPSALPSSQLTPEGAAKTLRSTPPTAPVTPGQLLAGKYRVESVLGVGGMGVVVSARHLQLGTTVALKFMLPEARLTPEATERFLREARAAVRIQGEHVARVMDVGQLENGAPYMVMEFLRGTDLAELLRVRGPLPIDDALDYLLQACEAIAEAHALGIVHRDLKPSNLFLTVRPDGSPLLKVLDFGISKHLGLADGANRASLTTGHAIMGSPRYMSPEQMRSTKAVDARTDVWALGCILYELLTAQPSFDGPTAPDLCAAIARGPAPSVRALRPDVPVEIEKIVVRCLEKDPSRRMSGVGELTRALAPLAPKRSQVCVERILRMAGGPRSEDLGFAPTVLSDAGPFPAASSAPFAASGGTNQNFARSNGTQARVRPSGTVFGLTGLVGVVLGVAGFIYVRGAGRQAATPASASVVTPIASEMTPSSATTPSTATMPTSTSTPTSMSASTSTPASTSADTSDEPGATKGTAPKKTPKPAGHPAGTSTAPVSPLTVDPNQNGLLDRK